MSQLFRQLDKHRLVHYEGVFNDRSYNDTSDMESQMYTPVAGIEKFLAEHPEKPFICCEYTHAMGNSCGAMHKYTELTDREPRYQGGFIWDYIDQSIYKKDRYGKWFLTYGGDFGDRPTDGDFSGNGICYGGEREASPKMQEVKFNYQNISVDFDSDYIFTVTNKNLFVNTSVFDAFAILLADGEEVYRTKLQISVPPMEQASYEVPVTLKNSMIDVEKEYCIVVSFVLKENTIWEKAGYEIAFGQHMIKKPVSEYSCDKSVELVVGNGNILVRGENFKALFSRMNLGMAVNTCYRKAGQEVVIYPGMAVCILQECHLKFRRYIVIKRQAAAVCDIISRGLEAEFRDKPIHRLPAIACRCASSSTDIVGGYMIEHGLGIEIVASLHLTVHNIKQSGFLCIYRCRATWHRTLPTVTGQEDSLLPESPFQSVCEFILSAHEQRGKHRIIIIPAPSFAKNILVLHRLVENNIPIDCIYAKG